MSPQSTLTNNLLKWQVRKKERKKERQKERKKVRKKERKKEKRNKARKTEKRKNERKKERKKIYVCRKPVLFFSSFLCVDVKLVRGEGDCSSKRVRITESI